MLKEQTTKKLKDIKPGERFLHVDGATILTRIHDADMFQVKPKAVDSDGDTYSGLDYEHEFVVVG